MEEIKIIFCIGILDKRNDKSIVHPARFFFTDNDIWAEVWAQSKDGNLNEHNGNVSDLQEISVDDYLNRNDRNWANLQEISEDALFNRNDDICEVRDTVRNMFRELIRMKELSDIPDNLVDSGDFSLKWKENDRLVPIPGVEVAGTSIADLIERFHSNHVGQNVMVVNSLLTLK